MASWSSLKIPWRGPFALDKQEPDSKANLLVAQDVNTKVDEYEAKLRKEMGLETIDVDHYEKPFERPWTKDQKDSVTILFGGMTAAHD